MAGQRTKQFSERFPRAHLFLAVLFFLLTLLAVTPSEGAGEIFAFDWFLWLKDRAGWWVALLTASAVMFLFFCRITKERR